MGHVCDLCMGINVEQCPGNQRQDTAPEEIESRYYALNLLTRMEVEVTENAWNCLPKDEDDAESKGEHYCRMEEGHVPLPDRRRSRIH